MISEYPSFLVELHVTFAYTTPPPALLMDAPRSTFFPPPTRSDLPIWCRFDGVKKHVVRDANSDFVAFLTTACPQCREDVPPKVPAYIRDRLVFVRLPRTVNWGFTGSTDALPFPEPNPPQERSANPVVAPACPASAPQLDAPARKRRNSLGPWRILERVKHVLRERK
ncbi:hypothetical protein C8R45DRAFT_1102495 [Mycena sanguinolenta]|nr:hypothetical protein C8R45DRAFT_1102495 [Mycena sanguinolenta]